MSETLERLTGALAGRYAVDRELGHGGMATVFLARDLKHDRDVAIKVLREDLSASLGRERFLAEIRVTAKLAHPNILPLLDSGEADGLLYYVMPYIEGDTLRVRMQREVLLPVDAAVAIAGDVADALGYAHEQHVVHRDIKPENILFAGGKAVVADFGIAHALSAAGGERFTAAGLALGTPSYMSPEQAAGQDVDGRSDEYSLGCLVYEMLAGEPPFTGPTPQAVLRKHIIDPVPTVSHRRDGVSEPIDLAIAKSMAKEPTDRFSHISQFGRALREPLLSSADIRLTPAASGGGGYGGAWHWWWRCSPSRWGCGRWVDGPARPVERR